MGRSVIIEGKDILDVCFYSCIYKGLYSWGWCEFFPHSNEVKGVWLKGCFTVRDILYVVKYVNMCPEGWFLRGWMPTSRV